MGLDILQHFDIEERDEDLELYDYDDNDLYSLSRTFCNFMGRRSVVEGEADLDQIGRMFGIDIQPLYLMEGHLAEWEMEEALEFDDDLDPDQFRKDAEETNGKLVGNIDRIIFTLESLISKLTAAGTIFGQINDHGFGTIPGHYYKNLDTNASGDYVDNNLTQDLRNMLRYCLLAKSKGAATTFFSYG